jgi:hypothetical protein
MKIKGAFMRRFFSLFLLVLLSMSSMCFAESNIDKFFSADQAKQALDGLAQESFKYQLLAEKIIHHPKYQKADKLPKSFEIYIRVTGTDINRLGIIDSEGRYLKPAHDRLYIERYMRYLEYKSKTLELELAKGKNSQHRDISTLTTEVEALEKELNSYFSDDMWPD